MDKGWNAKGLLAPLWRNYPGGRDGLAAAAGTHPPTLSAVNSGNRNLGWHLARRLAAELDVSVLELGAPTEDEPEPRDMYGLLERLIADEERSRAALAEALASIDARLSQIEGRLQPRVGRDSEIHTMSPLSDDRTILYGSSDQVKRQE